VERLIRNQEVNVSFGSLAFKEHKALHRPSGSIGYTR
jgi:hypothetical protein